jgi:hypothetical protein
MLRNYCPTPPATAKHFVSEPDVMTTECGGILAMVVTGFRFMNIIPMENVLSSMQAINPLWWKIMAGMGLLRFYTTISWLNSVNIRSYRCIKFNLFGLIPRSLSKIPLVLRGCGGVHLGVADDKTSF